MNQAAEQLSSAPASNVKLVGIGGWLLLLIVKLWVGVAVRVLAGISEQSHAVALLNFGLPRSLQSPPTCWAENIPRA